MPTRRYGAGACTPTPVPTAVYPIGVKGRDAIRRLVEEIGAPLNILAVPGGLSLAELGELGVARVSFGSGLMHIAMDAAAEQASHYRATGPG